MLHTATTIITSIRPQGLFCLQHKVSSNVFSFDHPGSHSHCQHCQLFILMLSPVEWVVEHWKNSGQEVWIEVVEVIPDVLQDSEHYMQTEIVVLIF